MSGFRRLDEDTPGWAKAIIAAAAVVVAAIVALIVVLVVRPGLHTPPHPSPAGPSTLSTAPTTSTVADSDSVCGLPDGDQSQPTSAPSSTTWTYVDSLVMPSNPQYGPGRTTATSRTCFARSPLGAVFAGMNVASSGSTSQNPNGVQFAGFRISNYTRDRAEISLALRITKGDHEGTLFAVDAAEQWKSGDWKDVSGSQQPTVLASLNGYVPFSAEGN